MAYSVLLAPEDTPLVVCIKQMDKHMFRHLKILYNAAYYIPKNNKLFSDFESLLRVKC
jgi:hypothetical protein